MFAAYVQWKTYLVARGHADLGRDSKSSRHCTPPLTAAENQRIPLVTAPESSDTGPGDEENETFNRHVSDSHTEEDDNLNQHATDSPNDNSVIDEGPSGEDKSDNKSSTSRLNQMPLFSYIHLQVTEATRPTSIQ